MIPEFVDKFMENKDKLRSKFSMNHPDSYAEIVKSVIEIINDVNDCDLPDPERIHRIDDGHYQGTLLFIIPEEGYQPYDYWYVKIEYGSCSGCDTLQRIRDNYDYENGEYDDKPNPSQISDYMTLALHIVQGIKKME